MIGRRRCEPMAFWIFSRRDVRRKYHRRGGQWVVVGSFISESAEDQWDECRGVSLVGCEWQSASRIRTGQKRRRGSCIGEPRGRSEVGSLSRWSICCEAVRSERPYPLV